MTDPLAVLTDIGFTDSDRPLTVTVDEGPAPIVGRELSLVFKTSYQDRVIDPLTVSTERLCR